MPRNLLTEREVAALFSLYYASGRSIHAHIPKQYVVSGFRKDFRGYVADALEDLARHPEGYVIKHPTRNNMTYQISEIGIAKLRELKLI